MLTVYKVSPQSKQDLGGNTQYTHPCEIVNIC